MGKDRQGKWRGKCTASDCVCALYTKEDPRDKLRCDYCEHAPGVHALLGKCSGCDQCANYEVDDEEEVDEEGECSYCGCEAEKHEVAAGKSAVPLQTGTSPVPPSKPAVPQANIPTISQAFGPTYPPPRTAGPAGQHGQLCKYPDCQKPCYVEGLKVHDFCGRRHASAYFAMRPGGPFATQPHPPMPYSAPRPPVSATYYPEPTPPSVAVSNTMQPPGQPPAAGPIHASPHMQTQVGAPPSSTPGSGSRPKCRNPQCERPCCVEGGKVFDYCGRTCRNAHESLNEFGQSS